MTNYTKNLPSSNESKTEWSYPNSEEPLKPETIHDIIQRMDSYHKKRTDADSFLKKYIVDSFGIYKKKFQVLHLVHTEIEENTKNKILPCDVIMLIFFEDSIKHLTINLDDVVDKLKKFINKDVRGTYMHLLKRNGLKKIINILISTFPQNANKYKARLNDYIVTWNTMFPNGLNNKGGPKEKDFSQLLGKIHENSKRLKDYRDKVAAHIDEKGFNAQTIPTLLWSELQDIINFFHSIINNLHFLLTFSSLDIDAIDGPGFKSNEDTAKSFLKAIY